jgi:hypothetical protein
MLCLIRDENWTFREATVRFGEQQDRSTALGLDDTAPDVHSRHGSNTQGWTTRGRQGANPPPNSAGNPDPLLRWL